MIAQVGTKLLVFRAKQVSTDCSIGFRAALSKQQITLAEACGPAGVEM